MEHVPSCKLALLFDGGSFFTLVTTMKSLTPITFSLTESEVLAWSPKPVIGYDHELCEYLSQQASGLMLESPAELTKKRKEIEKKIQAVNSDILIQYYQSYSPISFRTLEILLHVLFIHGTFAGFFSAMMNFTKIGVLVGTLGTMVIPLCLPLLLTLPYVLYKLYAKSIGHEERLIKTRALIVTYQESQLTILAQAVAQENQLPSLDEYVYVFEMDLTTQKIQLKQQSIESNRFYQKPAVTASRSVLNSTTLYTFYLSGSALYLILAFTGLIAGHYFAIGIVVFFLIAIAAYSYFHHRAVVENRTYAHQLMSRENQVKQIRQRLFWEPSKLGTVFQQKTVSEDINGLVLLPSCPANNSTQSL